MAKKQSTGVCAHDGDRGGLERGGWGGVTQYYFEIDIFSA